MTKAVTAALAARIAGTPAIPGRPRSQRKYERRDAAISTTAPRFPEDVRTRYFDSALGTMRSRAVGARRSGVPEVVLVQGMAVADYLLPGLGSFASWTRAHLVELPGFAGSGEPPYELDVTEFARCVSDWLAGHDLGTVMLAGHSSGTRGSRRTHGQNRCGGSPATCLIPEARDETSHRVGVAVERPLR